jgi:hypothetical protein
VDGLVRGIEPQPQSQPGLRALGLAARLVENLAEARIAKEQLGQALAIGAWVGAVSL